MIRNLMLCGVCTGLLGGVAMAQSSASRKTLDTDGSGTVEIAYFAFSKDIEDRILSADWVQPANGSEAVEVFVVVVDSWRQAGVANAGLIWSAPLRDQLDAMGGSDEMFALYDVQSDAVPYEKVLFVVTELDGWSVSDDCLTKGVFASLYEAAAVPAAEVLRCMQESQ
ncbi:hypothetical protein [Yoonia sp. BS5-3]|uniref:Uncharacterized protein n=1 Tax=Yoonia phaeophyticola TaxID=3137369 RepID=A0ABZ2V4N5_9RHOB